jgi:Gas vesicle protein K
MRRDETSVPHRSESSGELTALEPDQLAALRAQLDARIAEAMPARWNPDPEEVRRAVMKLVLTIVEFVRELLERQAVRRMEAQTLTPEQVEAVGLALMRLEEAVRDLAKQSGLEYDELNLDLGPLGRLL